MDRTQIKTIEQAKEYAEDFFNKNKQVNSPCLGCKVSYNGKGRRHLFYKGSNKIRPSKDTIRRTRLLELAKKVIEQSVFYTDYNVDSKGSQKLKYWSFVATVENVKLRVVVRQQGDNGEKHFWSVMSDRKKELYREG